MQPFASLLLIASLLLFTRPAYAQKEPSSDELRTLQGHDAIEEFMRSIAVPAAQARQAWPGVRERFINGLPPGVILTVVTIIKDDTGVSEIVDVRVERVGNGLVHGAITSAITALSGFNQGDPYVLPEDLLFDWLLVFPDGSGEGNYVGAFLDPDQGSATSDEQ